MSSIDDNIDYKIVHHVSGVVEIVVFNTDVFEKTGCEYEAQILSVSVDRRGNAVAVSVEDKDRDEVERFMVPGTAGSSRRDSFQLDFCPVFFGKPIC